MKQAKQLEISGQLPSPKGVALAVLKLSQRNQVCTLQAQRRKLKN